MTVSVTLQGDMRAILRDLSRVNGLKQDRAARRALAFAVRRIRTRTAQILGRRYLVPQRALRPRLIAQRRSKGDLWFFTALLNRILARDLGKPRELKRGGARAGRHLFEGAFVATMKSGKTLVMKRRAKPRLPIDERGVPLTGAKRFTDRNVNRLGAAAFKREFLRLMRRELARKR